MKTENFLLIFLITLVSCTFAADHDVYKTCSQSSFCRRNRNVQSRFTVDREGMTISPYAMSVDLINEIGIKFVLTIRAIEVSFLQLNC